MKDIFKDLIEEFIDEERLKKELANNLTEQEKRLLIKKVNEHNKKLYLKMKSQLDKKQIIKTVKNTGGSLKDFWSDDNEEIEEAKNLDITFYNELLNSCENLEELPKYLPRKSNPNFIEIMNLLIAKIIYEQKELEKFLVTEQLDKELYQEFFYELEQKEQLKKFLISFRDSTENLTIEQAIPLNQLIYLTTTKENIYPIGDLKQIPSDRYPVVMELLESILKGTFKNVKVLVSNDNFKGLLQVKNKDVRVVFKRIDKDIYLIIAIFIKKVQLSNSYLNYLTERCQIFQSQLEWIKQAIVDENYLENNTEITNSILKRLKKDDNNG